jgi:thiopurine S-methyltransferase
MEQDFWHRRWEKDQIGFHQTRVNQYLHTHWGELDLAPGARVFVPLCGKSLDMVWLRDQGYSVLGNELSALAVEAFFHENRIDFQTKAHGEMQRYTGGQIEILCGNFFDLRPEDTADIAAVYDRAALIAFPAKMRSDYAPALAELTPPLVPLLLITMEYPQEQMAGPPFSVREDEVRRLFAPHFDLGVVAAFADMIPSGQLSSRGLRTLAEKIYLMKRRAEQHEVG